MSGYTVSKIDMKLVLLGDSSVGKSSLIAKLRDDKFDEVKQHTIGGEFWNKKLKTTTHGKVNVGIWDTAGQEKFRAVSKIFFRGAQAAIVVTDLSDMKSSLEAVRFWTHEVFTSEPDTKIFFCGNKVDLLPEGSANPIEDELIEYSKSMGSKYWRTSAKTGDGVETMFTDVTELSYRAKEEEEEAKDLVVEEKQHGEVSGGCSC